MIFKQEIMEKKSISLRVPVDLLKRIKAEAEESDRDITKQIVHIIRKYYTR